MRSIARLALFVIIASIAAANVAMAQLPPPTPWTNEVVRVFAAGAYPLPEVAPRMADYAALVVALLDRCARSAPVGTIPFAGRALLNLIASPRGARLSVVDVDPGLSDLEARCVAPQRDLPPIPTAAVAPRHAPSRAMWMSMDVDIDARGLPDATPIATGRRLARSVELSIDTRNTHIYLYDGASPSHPRIVLDEVLLAIGPRLPALARCLDGDIARGAYRGEDVSLTFSIDYRGVIREVRSSVGLGAGRCFATSLRATRLEPWEFEATSSATLILHAH